MYKGKDLIGKMIVAYDSGEKIGTIKDLIFDQHQNCLLGFVVKEANWFRRAQILPLYLVKAFGSETIVVPSRAAICPSVDRANIHKVLQDARVINGKHIVTTDGRDLGKLIDFYFDEQTGIVEGYEVSGGRFTDADSGRSFVPATHVLEIGKEVAFIPTETVGSIAPSGSWKAALQTANDKLQEPAHAGQKLPAAGCAANPMTDAIIERSAQKALDLGKDDPSLWEKVTATASDIQGHAQALEQKRIRGALGRPTIRLILDRDNKTILNVGELITHRAIDSARSAGILDVLLDSAYTESLHLSIDELRAPGTGKSAL